MHQPKTSLHVENPSAVDHGRRRPRIAVVTALEKIEATTGDPLFDLDPRRVFPGERPCAVRLIASIDLHRVVRTRAAQASAFAAVADIFECSGIAQETSPFANQSNG